MFATVIIFFPNDREIQIECTGPYTLQGVVTDALNGDFGEDVESISITKIAEQAA